MRGGLAGGVLDGGGPHEDSEVRGGPLPQGPFRCVSADPPWPYRDKLKQSGTKRGAASNYRLLKLPGILTFLDDGGWEVEDDAFLFLWRVGPFQQSAFRVMMAWGFEPTGAEIVWVKTTGPKNPFMPSKLAFGMGHYVRNCHETCMIGRRGKAKVLNRSMRSVFEAPVGRHSEKPDEFYAIVEKLCDGPRLELFGRKRRTGWTVIGDEVE